MEQTFRPGAGEGRLRVNTCTSMPASIKRCMNWSVDVSAPPRQASSHSLTSATRMGDSMPRGAVEREPGTVGGSPRPAPPLPDPALTRLIVPRDLKCFPEDAIHQGAPLPRPSNAAGIAFVRSVHGAIVSGGPQHHLPGDAKIRS